MQLTLYKKILFSKIRYLVKCNHCKNPIVLDADIFKEFSDRIFCFICKKTYLVTKINHNKLNISVQVKEDMHNGK
jgi:ribosomal protein S27E